MSSVHKFTTFDSVRDTNTSTQKSPSNTRLQYMLLQNEQEQQCHTIRHVKQLTGSAAHVRAVQYVHKLLRL